MNRIRVAALLRELAAALEADDLESTGERPAAPPKSKPKPNAEDHAKASAALSRAGVYPRGAWRP